LFLAFLAHRCLCPSGDKILMLDGATLPKMLGRKLRYIVRAKLCRRPHLPLPA
jgi:hypothetical protein